MGLRLLPYPGLAERYIEACATNDATLVRYLLTNYRVPNTVTRTGLKNAVSLGNTSIMNIYRTYTECLGLPTEGCLSTLDLITGTQLS